MYDTLKHDVAAALTRQLVEMLACVLSPVERDVAREQFYATVRAGLDAYDQQKALMMQGSHGPY